MEEMGDNPKDPRWALLEIVTKSIDEYEARVEPEMACVFESYGCTSILRVLMDQYQLRPSDFPEIGSQEVVGQVLNGKRQLNLNQVTALSQRFGVEPNLFF
jgi:HTH-type transcriptional regulator/antitoxin HigA